MHGDLTSLYAIQAARPHDARAAAAIDKLRASHRGLLRTDSIKLRDVPVVIPPFLISPVMDSPVL